MSSDVSDQRRRRNTGNRALPALRAPGQDQGAEEDRRGSGGKFASALLSVFESGDDPLRQILLESGLPILPSDGQAPRRGQAARDAKLQIHGHGRNGNHGDQPGAQALPPAGLAEVVSSRAQPPALRGSLHVAIVRTSLRKSREYTQEKG